MISISRTRTATKSCVSNISLSRKIHSTPSSTAWFSKKKKEEETLPMEAEPASLWSHLTDEEVMKIRDKSRLPSFIKSELAGQPRWQRLPSLSQYKRDFVQQYYAKYGEATGIKPGVCWGNKQEIEFQLEWERTFYPDLKTLIETDIQEKEAAAKTKARDKADIVAKVAKLPKAIEDFYKKIEAKKKEAELEKIKKEKLVQEVREYLGYDVSPGDSRFQEALKKKDEEERKASKQSKKQEKAAQIMAKIQAMAEEAEKSAKDESSTATNKDEEKK
ncbi:Growth arrest and DNA damage-inducible proteins-interacting protein 1 [Halotydeus destructor]|nr:Growth arrest and DNA damage-inducible proteins-interacting protein 1 [Halotydeus destructor]